MLILSRAVGQEVHLVGPDGTRIVLVLSAASRRRAQIGIAAPREWQIYREECLPAAPAEAPRPEGLG